MALHGPGCSCGIWVVMVVLVMGVLVSVSDFTSIVWQSCGPLTMCWSIEEYFRSRLGGSALSSVKLESQWPKYTPNRVWERERVCVWERKSRSKGIFLWQLSADRWLHSMAAQPPKVFTANLYFVLTFIVLPLYSSDLVSDTDSAPGWPHPTASDISEQSAIIIIFMAPLLCALYCSVLLAAPLILCLSHAVQTCWQAALIEPIDGVSEEWKRMAVSLILF